MKDKLENIISFDDSVAVEMKQMLSDLLVNKDKCINCKKHINAHEVGAYIPLKGKVAMICQDTSCLIAYAYKTEDKNGSKKR